MNPRVLFISHNASLTGAPMVLLQLLRWIRGNTSIEFEIAMRRGGPLLSDFQALARTTILEARFFHSAMRIGARPLRDMALAAAQRRFRRAVNPGQFDLIYCNTVACGSVIDALTPAAAPCVAHVHELELAIQQIAGLESFQTVRNRARRFIAMSDAVKRNLVGSHGVPADQIDVIHAFVDAEAAAATDVPQARVALRKVLGLDAGAFIIGATGTADWRKGPDLFLQLALAAREQGWDRSVHFVWIGADPAAIQRLQRDAQLIGMSDRVHILPPRPNAQAAIAGFDLFALTSREEPLGLVMIEAACAGIPTVCFDGAGGAPEFTMPDCGVAVPYLSVTQMARTISRLLLETNERRRLGANAKARALAEFDVRVGAPRIAAVIQELVSTQQQSRHE